MKSYFNDSIFKQFFISAVLALSCQAHEYNWNDFRRDNEYRQTKLSNASKFDFKIYNTLHKLPKEKKLEAAQLLLVELIDTAHEYYHTDITELLDEILKQSEIPSLNFVIKEKNISYFNYAIINGCCYAEMLQFLLEKGCSIKSIDGQNSLLLAVKARIKFQKQSKYTTRINEIDVLLEKNANPNYVSSSGESVQGLLDQFENESESVSTFQKEINLEFIQTIKQRVQEVENKKKTGRNMIERFLSHPQSIDEEKKVTTLPPKVALLIAEYAYPYRD